MNTMPQIAPKCPVNKVTNTIVDLPPEAEGLTQEQRRAIQLHIPAYPDGESGGIRTLFRQHADSNPAIYGHLPS
jgi:hypothetical protein